MVAPAVVYTVVIFLIIILFSVLVIISLQRMGIRSSLLGNIPVLSAIATSILAIFGIKN